MKKYHFRLQTVLEKKEKILEEKMLELAKVVSASNEAKALLMELESKKNGSTKSLGTICTEDTELDIAQIQVYKAYLTRVDFEIKKQEEEIKKLDELLQKKQEEVNIALKEKKIFEKLKEKEENEFYKEIIRKENLDNDDIATSRYAR